jgi:hypothetical protein
LLQNIYAIIEPMCLITVRRKRLIVQQQAHVSCRSGDAPAVMLMFALALITEEHTMFGCKTKHDLRYVYVYIHTHIYTYIHTQIHVTDYIKCDYLCKNFLKPFTLLSATSYLYTQIYVGQKLHLMLLYLVKYKEMYA